MLPINLTRLGNPVVWAAVGLGVLAVGTRTGRKVLRSAAVGAITAGMTIAEETKELSASVKREWRSILEEAKARREPTPEAVLPVAPEPVVPEPVEA